MPLEMRLWRVEADRARAVRASGIDAEGRLEALIAGDVEILGLGPLMLLGRQVIADSGARIDLLALDEDGTVYVVELKRGRTPRDVVAQALDYGSWVRRLSAERLAHLFESGVFAAGRTFNTAFADRYGSPPPEIINETHRLVIVASELDPATQRIVDYLLEEYGVPVNVVFFHYFQDGEREYLGRSWLHDPIVAEERTRLFEIKRTPGEWNGQDYYVAYGDEHRRSWEDARRYGYVSAGGAARWSKPLFKLQAGARVFVHIPGRGYVGVGRVRETAVPIGDFKVRSLGGDERSMLELPLRNDNVKQDADDPERAEYFVRVDWEQTVPTEQAYWERGRGLFYRRGQSVAELRDPDTSSKVLSHFGIAADESPVQPSAFGGERADPAIETATSDTTASASSATHLS